MCASLGRSVPFAVICACAHGRMRGDPRSSPRASCCCYYYVSSRRPLARRDHVAKIIAPVSRVYVSVCLSHSARNTERWWSPDTLLEPAVYLALPRSLSFIFLSVFLSFYPGFAFPRTSHSSVSLSLSLTPRHSLYRDDVYTVRHGRETNKVDQGVQRYSW